MASGVSPEDWTREGVIDKLNDLSIMDTLDDLPLLTQKSAKISRGGTYYSHGTPSHGWADYYGISTNTAQTIYEDYDHQVAPSSTDLIDAIASGDTDEYPWLAEISERYWEKIALQVLWHDATATKKYIGGSAIGKTHFIDDGEIVPRDAADDEEDEDDDEDVTVGLNAGEDTDEDVDEDVDEDTGESENETASESTDASEFGLGTVSDTGDEFDGPEEILDFSFRVSDNDRLEYSLNRETNVIEGDSGGGAGDELYVGSVSDLVDAVIHVDDFETAESVFVENDDVVLRGDTSKTRTPKKWFTQAENVVRLYGTPKYLIGFDEYGDADPIISTEDEDFAVLIKGARSSVIMGFPSGVEESEEAEGEAEEQEEPETSEESNQPQNQTRNQNPKPPEPDEDGDIPEDIYIDTVANLSGIGESTAEDLYMDGAPTPDEWLTEDGDLIDIVQDNVHTRFHDDLIEDVETTEFGFGNLETSDAAKAMGDHLERSPNAIRSDEAKQAKNVTEDYDEWSEAPGEMDFVGVDGGDPDDLETDDEQTTFGAQSFMNDEDEEDGDMKTVAEYGESRIQADGDEYRLEVNGNTYEWSDDSPAFLNVHENGIDEVSRLIAPRDILIVAETIEGRRQVPHGAPYPMVDVFERGRDAVGFETVSGEPTIEDHPKLILRILSEHSKAGNETYIDPDIIETYANGDYEGTFPEQNDPSMDYDGETVSMTATPADSPTGIGSFSFEAFGDRVEWTSDDKPEMLGVSEDGVEEISRLKFDEDYDDLAIDGDIHRTQGTPKLLLISEYPHKESIKSADYDKTNYYFLGTIKKWAIDPTPESVEEMVRNLVEEEGEVAVDTVAIEEIGRHQ